MPKAAHLTTADIPLVEGASYITDLQLARSARGVGGYMGKYLSKTFSDKWSSYRSDRSRRRWATSRNFIRPSTATVLSASLTEDKPYYWTRSARAVEKPNACCRHDRLVTFFPTTQRRTGTITVGDKRFPFQYTGTKRLRVYDFRLFGLDTIAVAKRLHSIGKADIIRSMKGVLARSPL